MWKWSQWKHANNIPLPPLYFLMLCIQLECGVHWYLHGMQLHLSICHPPPFSQKITFSYISLFHINTFSYISFFHTSQNICRRPVEMYPPASSWNMGSLQTCELGKTSKLKNFSIRALPESGGCPNFLDTFFWPINSP